jgi:Flp pilus assembly pilin Flp
MCKTDTDIPTVEQSRICSEQGQTLVEYAMILGFVSISALALTPIGEWVAARLGVIGSAL